MRRRVFAANVVYDGDISRRASRETGRHLYHESPITPRRIIIPRQVFCDESMLPTVGRFRYDGNDAFTGDYPSLNVETPTSLMDHFRANRCNGPCTVSLHSPPSAAYTVAGSGRKRRGAGPLGSVMSGQTCVTMKIQQRHGPTGI